MSNSRRKFLKAGLLTALFTAVPLKNTLGRSWRNRGEDQASTPAQQNDVLATYSKATFTYYLRSIFELQTNAGTVEVTLTKVEDMPAAKGGECFSLLFRADRRRLSQDTYTLVHPALGEFQLLLVPAGADKHGTWSYLATINRLVA
jgi:hypothetical protein